VPLDWPDHYQVSEVPKRSRNISELNEILKELNL
jgi:hypothetical protein